MIRVDYGETLVLVLLKCHRHASFCRHCDEEIITRCVLVSANLTLVKGSQIVDMYVLDLATPSHVLLYDFVTMHEKISSHLS